LEEAVDLSYVVMGKEMGCPDPYNYDISLVPEK
jgi:hypothetical protein